MHGWLIHQSAWNWSSANYFALTGFSEVVCVVAFLKMYRLADVPNRRNSLGPARRSSSGAWIVAATFIKYAAIIIVVLIVSYG